METADSASDAPGRKPRISVADAMQELERQFEALVFKARQLPDEPEKRATLEKVTIHITFGDRGRYWVVVIKIHTKGSGTDETFMEVNPNPDVAMTGVLAQFEKWILSQHSVPEE